MSEENEPIETGAGKASPVKSPLRRRLIKSAFTFGDWFPYVLWKIGRHSGKPLEATERQRQHPFIFGVPVLLKLLLRGDLR